MSAIEIALVFLAGVGAGTINVVVGSGTLITFPTLLAVGIPPVTANMSNSLGLVPGSIAGAWGYRRELRGQGERVRRLLLFSTGGAVVGAVVLLVLPPGAFEAIVPVLILVGVALVVLQPRLSRLQAARAQAQEPRVEPGAPRSTGTGWLLIAVFGTGVYGGYFGAAQGVILMGVLSLGIVDHLQRLNAVKNVLVAVVNAVAGLIFVVVAQLGLFGTDVEVDWLVVAVIALGSVLGGLAGAAVGRRLAPVFLRSVIVTIGVIAILALLVS